MYPKSAFEAKQATILFMFMVQRVFAFLFKSRVVTATVIRLQRDTTERERAAYLFLLPHARKQGSSVALCWVRLDQTGRASGLSSKREHCQFEFRTPLLAWYIFQQLIDLRSWFGPQAGVYQQPRTTALVQTPWLHAAIRRYSTVGQSFGTPTPSKQESA